MRESATVHDGSRGIAGIGHPVGDILSDHGSRTYYAAVAYGDTRQDSDVGSEPAVYADGDGFPTDPVIPAFRRIHRMDSCDEMAVRTDHRVVADCYRGGVEECAVVVDDEVLPEDYVVSEVASERKDHPGAGIHFLLGDVREGGLHLLAVHDRRVVSLKFHVARCEVLYVFSVARVLGPQEPSFQEDPVIFFWFVRHGVSPMIPSPRTS